MSEAKSDLRKACKAAAKYLCDEHGQELVDFLTGNPSIIPLEEVLADIIERHMTPVFERMRDEVIEELL